MAIILSLTGKTFEIKEQLKADGYRWNPENKAWSKSFADNEPEYVKNLAESFEADGKITATIKSIVKASTNEPKYRVKESWIFNLESMHDKLWCLSYNIEEGNVELPLKIAGKTINSVADLFDLKDEAEELEWKAKSGKVTGKEFGRIKEIVAWRVEARYVTCLAAGMKESEAGKCFEDM